MPNIRYTKDHEYIRPDPDGAVVGITDFAQSQLGDVVFVELPVIGAVLARGAEAAVVESVKAASGVNAPASGEVIEVNSALEEKPGLVNEDPNGSGWFFKLTLADPSELDALMDEEAYEAFIKTIA
ncbi:glycine cleavage system H protein [Methylocella silvestris BL2]|uniref:Glycine cleavage system H protein n=1 Tax=Methylocella silvestris (strain DSM 15510 / CIP 108128 / LMG 27833 / NCIMB 13906 / BL2) TaxID=395965 RepID=GCSH_METSB|nr:glycine cleavage system protein GcvH [Methylocella silvestris]B8EPI0.1 RecName: Full=Glycine cleavage system H protein [Methylocella silvestris BL2]ACK50185.1 glycine cleavage system H protein [Methylocella silvestris BL2]